MNRDGRFKQLIHIINELCKKDDRSGETVIQKLVYLIIKGKFYEFDYHYTLYNYGPYSFDLKDDIIYLEESQIINKIPHPSGFGFKYVPNTDMPIVKSSIKEMRFQGKIDKIIRKFKKIPAKHLGLLTTFIYIYEKEKIEDDEKLINRILEIKPMFSRWEVESTLKKYQKVIRGNIEDFLSEPL